MAGSEQLFKITSLTVRVGETITIADCGVQYANSNNHAIAATSNPSSSDYSVIITGVAAGTAKLSGYASANTCTVTVVEPDRGKYVDQEGLRHFWNKVKEYIDSK